MCVLVPRMPTTWQSCRSPSNRARPSRSSTAAPEPCTTLLLPTTIIITCSIRRPLSRPPLNRWTPSARQPAPLPCPHQQPPAPPPPPASAGMSPQPGSQPRARHAPPSWHAAPCPSPARTLPATCARSSATPTSTRTWGPSTPCRSSPPREGAHQPAPSAPSARRGWRGGASGKEQGEGRGGGRRRLGSGGLALRSCGRCMSEPRPATSEFRHMQTNLTGPWERAPTCPPNPKQSISRRLAATEVGKQRETDSQRHSLHTLHLLTTDMEGVVFTGWWAPSINTVA